MDKSAVDRNVRLAKILFLVIAAGIGIFFIWLVWVRWDIPYLRSSLDGMFFLIVLIWIILVNLIAAILSIVNQNIARSNLVTILIFITYIIYGLTIFSAPIWATLLGE